MTSPTWRWATFSSLIACIIGFAPASSLAGRFPSADEAVRVIYDGAESIRETYLLLDDEKSRAGELAGQDDVTSLVTRYVMTRGDEVVGYAYLDKHRVRTLPEILMIALDAEGTLIDIKVLAFKEPLEYMAREGWFDQFKGMSVDDAIRMRKNIDGISGATLTARATTQCARRVMAIHEVLKDRTP